MTPIAKEVAQAVWSITSKAVWEWNESAKTALDLISAQHVSHESIRKGVRQVLKALGQPVPEEYRS